jgi:hypothetical protein
VTLGEQMISADAARPVRHPQNGPKQMTLFDLFRQALDDGGDAVSKAMGHTEAQLVRDPDDTVARAMKGALLTLVTDDVLTEARRGDYRRTGIMLMQEVLAQLPPFSADGAATRFVVALGLAGLPVGDGQRQAAEQLLRRLVHSPELGELQAWQQLRVQVMLAGLAQLGGDDAAARKAYAAAKAIEPEMAVQLFCAFIDGQGGGGA